MDKEGYHSFQALQHRDSHPKHQTAFYAFDLLDLDGVDLTQVPIDERRSRLREHLPAHTIPRDRILYAFYHVIEPGGPKTS